MRYTPLLLLLLTSTAWAADPGAAVHVVSHGGVRSLPRLELDTSGPQAEVIANGATSAVPDGEGAVILEDVKVLPDGTLLLANVSDQGVALHDPDASQTRLLFRNSDRTSDISSASVASYVGAGTPARILLTDAGISAARLWDLAEDRELWATSLFSAGSPAEIVQGIVMPGGKLALATNWRSADLYGVELFSVNPDSGLPQRTGRLANKEVPDQPGQTVVNDALVELRDVMALTEDSLLITTQFRALAIGLDGQVAWTIDVANAPELSGELASARALPSGHIAVATFEPGVWTRPHPNHKIHWYEIVAGEPVHVASSQTLEAAPRRVLSADGTGGTGTLGWSAGLGEVGQGMLSQIEVSDGLTINDETFDRGDTLRAAFTVRNGGELPVTIPRLAIAAIQGRTCLDANEPTTLVLEAQDVTLTGLSKFELSGDVPLGPDYLPGSWCLYPAMQDAQGVWTRLRSQALWTLRESGSVTLPSQDLELRDGPALDMSPDADMDALPEPNPPAPGCGCATQSSSPAPLGLGVFLMFGMWSRRRRQRIL